MNPSDLPVNIQLEITDLQCDSDLKGKFAAASLGTFCPNLLPGYPNLTSLAAKLLSMFGTTSNLKCFIIDSEVVVFPILVSVKQRKQSEVVVFKLYTMIFAGPDRLGIGFPLCGACAKMSLTPLLLS